MRDFLMIYLIVGMVLAGFDLIFSPDAVRKQMENQTPIDIALTFAVMLAIWPIVVGMMMRKRRS